LRSGLNYPSWSEHNATLGQADRYVLRIWLSHHRAGSGPPLVLIHGIGSRWQVWEPVLEILGNQREVVALDLPGFGDAPRPPAGTPPGVGSLTRLVGEFLTRLGLDRPHLGGNSLGGRIALELAKQGRGRSVTVLSPAGFHNRIEAVYQQATLWAVVRAARLLAPHADRVMARPRSRALAMGQMTARPQRIPPSDAAASLRALANAPWFDETLTALHRDPFSDGSQIRVPVTIAWGEHDRLLLPHQAERARAMIPQARILVLRGCGHVPTYDDPERVAQVLLDGSMDS
jgi:pimeloyl-ACP methyl ester carboxylesterase